MWGEEVTRAAGGALAAAALVAEGEHQGKDNLEDVQGKEDD